MTTEHRSFVGRAVLAVALLLGFYVLAFAVAGALIAAILTTAADGRIAYWFIPAALAAYAVLRGVFFIERGEQAPTGIRIDQRSQPRLHAAIVEVAEAMRTRAPDQVFLIPDVNAFVYEQGRLLGLIRTKRIMGIGLALTSVLEVDELRSVLAHEYGHYVGGDTRLGGMIYRARASIARTISHLGSSWLRRIFTSYGALFLRLTQQISRDQELAADSAAARVGGREAHSSALGKVVGGGAAFDAFMEEFVVPLWHEKRYPDNLYAGFRSFVADAERRDQIAGYVERVRDREDRYDSHPSLGRRLAHIAESGDGADSDPRPARDLIVDPDSAERQMSRIVSGIAVQGERLSAISWEETADVRAARVRASADAFIDALGPDGIRIDGDRLARVVLVLEKADANKIVRRLVPVQNYPPEAMDGIVDDAIHYYVAATLANDLIERHGYRVELSWTKPFLLRAPNGTTVDVGERVGQALESKDLRSLLLSR